MKPNFKILLLLLASISLDDAYNSVIVESSGGQNSITKAFICVALFGSQIVFSSLQAGFSDFSSRKRSLIFAFLITLFALMFLPFNSKSLYFTYFLFIASLLKGIGGNIVPIARAGLAEAIKRNFRFAIGLSTSAIAVGYIFVKMLSQRLNTFSISVILITTIPIIVFVIINFYIDKHDKDPTDKPDSFLKSIKRDAKLLYTDFLRDKIFFLSASSYFFWELSFYLVFIKDVELGSGDFKNFSLAMCIGYVSGVLLLGAARGWRDQRILKLGYHISIASIAFIFIVYISGISLLKQFAPIYGFFGYSFGFGFFVPCLFSMVSRARQPHEQGKIYGLIDSTDTIAFTTALLLDIFITSFKLIIISSFIFLLIGSFVYNSSIKYWRFNEERL